VNASPTTEDRLEVFAALHGHLEIVLVVVGPLVIIVGILYGVFAR